MVLDVLSLNCKTDIAIRNVFILFLFMLSWIFQIKYKNNEKVSNDVLEDLRYFNQNYFISLDLLREAI